MIAALLLIPTVAGLLSFVVRPNWPRRAILLATAAAHLGFTIAAWQTLRNSSHGIIETVPMLHDWMAIDAVSLLFLTIASVLFMAAAIYAVGYLANEGRHVQSLDYDELPFVNFPEATFAGCMLLFLATMTLVAVSRHWGLMWVAVEATTLASAPLIYYHRSCRSLEATWKYLVICSVGIALALLGNFFLAVATQSCGESVHMTIDSLMAHATSLDRRWLQGAFLLFLVGYGTKMGLAPLHTWLPDAHSEAPSVVSALLSGSLLNCAFLAILRGHALLGTAGLADFSSQLLIIFGLISMCVAAIFILGQADFKRMLAYSSVEHMGILSLGVGIGGIATFGAMLHAVNHSLAKAMLFLLAGNMLAVYRTKSTVGTRDVLQRMPTTGILWIVGFLAIVGSPPFGLFVSELTILQGAINGKHWIAAAIYLLALLVVFAGMATIVLNMVYGPADKTLPEATKLSTPHEPLWSIAPPMVLAATLLVLGIYVPPALADLMHRAAQAVGAN